MKTIKNIQYLLLSLFVAGSVFTACKEDTVPFNIEPKVELQISPATESMPEPITRTAAFLDGILQKNNWDVRVQKLGVQFATNESFSTDAYGDPVKYDFGYSSEQLGNKMYYDNDLKLRFNGHINQLRPGTRYWVRAYAVSDVTNEEFSTAYGPSIQITTLTASAPTMDNVRLGEVTAVSMPVSAQITDFGSDGLSTDAITMSGFIYMRVEPGYNPNDMIVGKPGLTTVIEFPNEADSTLTSTLTDLIPGETYAVRAFALSSASAQPGYSEITTFRTTSTSEPAVSLARNDGTTSSSVTVSANIIAQGTSSVTEHGFVYSTTEKKPELVGSERIQVALDESSDFRTTIPNLHVGTTYYIRAYATNDAGTGYSSEALEVTISGTVTVPVVLTLYANLTTSADATAANMAQMAGLVNDNGGAQITATGFELATNERMQDAVTVTAKLDAQNMFSAVSGQLEAGVTYYIRAYASNSAGSGYGNIVTVTVAAPDIVAPTVVTSQPTDVTQDMALLHGVLTSDGGADITAVGFEVSTNSDFAAEEGGFTRTVEATLDGQEFVGEVFNLEPERTYYVRAFAENSAGRGRGSVRVFTTPAAEVVITAPTVTTEEPKPTDTTAELIGVVTSDGGAAVTRAGFEISIDPSMLSSTTITVAGTLNAEGTQFSATATGLTASTGYYVRAFAVNSAGTAYGEIVEFATSEPSVVTPGEDDNPYPSQGVKGQRKAKARK